MLISKEDWFSVYDNFYFPYFDTTAVIGKKIMQNLPEEIYFNREEFPNDKSKYKNFIMGTCLHYYVSRELDSIAKEAYKNNLKREAKIHKDYYGIDDYYKTMYSKHFKRK